MSNVMGGYIADRYDYKSLRLKSWICMWGSILASVPLIFCYSNIFGPFNFWFSCAMLAFKFLFNETWISPAITMMQNTCKPENQGTIVSGHLFYTTLAGTLAVFIFGQILNFLGAAQNPVIIGKLMIFFSLFGFVGSIPMFRKAGKHYERMMKK